MQHKEYRLAVVMFTDIQGFSRMLEKDERGTLDLLDYQNELISRLSLEHKGRVIKTVGDVVLVEFSTTLDAVGCAVAIQSLLGEFNRTSGKESLRLRIGIHLGDIYFYENDAIGEGINIASQLQTVAFPGCICVSQDVYNNVVNKIEADFRDLGRVKLKNITKEIRAYEIVTSAAVGYNRAAVPGPKGPAAAGAPPQGAAQPPEKRAGAQEFDELKGFVVEQIKRVGRRISVERVRSIFPNPGPEFDEAVERLADMGFLTREGRGTPGGPAGSPRAPRPPAWMDGMNEWRGPSGFDREALRAAREEWRHSVHGARHAARNRDRARSRDEWRRASREAGTEGADELGDREWGFPAGYEEYRARVIERAAKARGGLAAHLVTFLIVNAGLGFINLTTSPSFLWFLIPLLGWGIGAVSHVVGVGTRQAEKREVEALPEQLEDADYKLLRRFHHARSGARSAAASLVMVAVLLVTINLLTSPHFPWAIFPLAGLAIGLISSTVTYLVRRGGFRKRLRELIRNKKSIDADHIARADVADDPPIVKQALQLADAILVQAKDLDPGQSYLGEDMKPLLENYIGQVRKLSRKSREVDEIMATIPRVELDRDLATLRGRHEQATNPTLKAEYLKSIEQIERQNRSFEELKSQKELMDLKIANSVNSLKQMQLDIARMVGMAQAREPMQVDAVKKRTHELSERIEDLGASYAELERMPAMGEREREVADRLLQDFKQREAEREGSNG